MEIVPSVGRPRRLYLLEARVECSSLIQRADKRDELSLENLEIDPSQGFHIAVSKVLSNIDEADGNP